MASKDTRMQDLGFVLDGLYAAGWWPSEGDRCLQDTDGRWYPDEAMMLESFAQTTSNTHILASEHSASVEIVWSSSDQNRQSVHGRSRTEALILAFTRLYIESHPCTQSV